MYLDSSHTHTFNNAGLYYIERLKVAPSQLKIAGVGINLTSSAPYIITGVHPHARVSEGIPFIAHLGDEVVAVDDIALQVHAVAHTYTLTCARTHMHSCR